MLLVHIETKTFMNKLKNLSTVMRSTQARGYPIANVSGNENEGKLHDKFALIIKEYGRHARNITGE